MTDVTAIVSAYHVDTDKHLSLRLDNLERQDANIVVVCQKGSWEHSVVKERLGIVLITTQDVPTLYGAWNLAIKHSRGKYITSANTDDLVYDGALWRMADFLDENPDVALVHGDCDLEEYGRIDVQWRRTPPSVSPTHCTVGPMPMWRRKLHAKYGMFDETFVVAGDFEFWNRIQAGGERIEHIDLKTGLYVRRENSLEHRNQGILAVENERVRRRYG